MDPHQRGGCHFLNVFSNHFPLKALSETGDWKPPLGKLELLLAWAVFSAQQQVLLKYCIGWEAKISVRNRCNTASICWGKCPGESKRVLERVSSLHPLLGQSPGVFQTSLTPTNCLFCLCLFRASTFSILIGKCTFFSLCCWSPDFTKRENDLGFRPLLVSLWAYSQDQVLLPTHSFGSPGQQGSLP